MQGGERVVHHIRHVQIEVLWAAEVRDVLVHEVVERVMEHEQVLILVHFVVIKS